MIVAQKFACRGALFLSNAFSTQTTAILKQKRQALLAIESPRAFFQEIKKKGTGKNAVPSRNLLHLMKRCKDPADIPVAAKAITYFQWKGTNFSPLFCSYFINLCVRADKPKVVADMIVDPKHRLGAWLGKKSAKTLFESLAKANELETMIKIANVSLARGLAVHTKESIGSLMTAVSLAGTAEQQAAVLSIAEKSVTAEDLAALKVQFAAPAAAEEASVEEEAK